ncbi:Wdr19, partial [Symbiodinium sp. KB8]
EVRDDMTVLNAAHGDIESLAWTPDGQMLSVATGGGYLYTFLATMPSVYDHYESRVAFMSSLQEVSIVDTSRPADDPSASVRIAVGVEPAFLALGPNHVAVGMNDTVEFHALDLSGSASRTYVGAVDEVKLGPYHAAVRSNGQVHLHAIDSALVASRGLPGAEGVTVLPPPDAAAAGAGASGAVTCIAMTRTFLYWGTSQGSIGLFHMPDWRPLDGHPFVHPEAGRGVTAIFPNGPGTRALVLDTAGSAVLYNPVNGLVLKVPDVPPGTKKAIWDSSAWGVFALSDDKALRPYLHLPLTITGAALKPLGQAVLGEGGHLSVTSKDTPLPAGTVPTSMANGVCLCAPSSGSTSTVQRVTLTSHRALGTAGRVADGRLREMLAASLALYDMQAAWAHAYALQDTSLWVAVANRALEVLDIDTAMRVYRTKGDVGMVVALEDIAAEEDQALVAGHVAVLFGNFGLAQELYLSSGRPTAALYMHRDLQQYEQAMKLAESLAPDIIPELSVEYGKQLEFQGKYADALGMYQQANLGLPTEGSGDAADIASEAEALLGAGGGTAALEAKKPADTEVPDELPPAKSKVERLRRAVHDGTTRTLLRTGDLRRGMSMADEAKFAHKALYKDAGMILEGIKQVPEAAKMYTKAGLVDKAVAMLLTAKSFRAAAPLMPKVRAARLHAQYAKAMEASGDYKAAAASYEKARDLDSVVRLLVDQLGMQERAGAIVRQTRSPPAALHLSQYCQTVGDTRGAIEFLLIAQKPEEAFGLAMTHDEMELYVSVLTDFGLTVTTDDYARIAGYYEGKSDWAAAGRYYEKAEDLRKALMYYLKCGTAQVDAAIALVGSAKRSEHPLSDELTHRLLDDLTGERSSVVHDPRSIFKLYLALGKHRRAGETALVIARAEQTNGKYSKAHETLFESYGMLSENSVKKLVALGDHTGAAHMLKRVVASISQFERHTVQVLTSAVIECQRAGMKRSSFQFASALMRPEHREHIKPEFRRKIEALVRRPKDEEAEVDLTPCPVCTTRIPAYALDCPTCRSHLPYCIVSGKHMVLEDWSSCPTCSWPALHSAFAAYLTKHDECPMCSTSVPATTVTLVEDPAAELKRCMALGEASESDSPEADADSGAAAEQASPQSPSPGGEAYDADGKTGEGEAEEGVAKRPKPQVSGAAAVLGAMGL